jgi:hypothetical protein
MVNDVKSEQTPARSSGLIALSVMQCRQQMPLFLRGERIASDVVVKSVFPPPSRSLSCSFVRLTPPDRPVIIKCDSFVTLKRFEGLIGNYSWYMLLKIKEDDLPY